MDFLQYEQCHVNETDGLISMDIATESLIESGGITPTLFILHWESTKLSVPVFFVFLTLLDSCSASTKVE